MNMAIAAMLAALPNALLALGAKLFTEKFMQLILEKLLIFGMDKAAKMTTNTVDDDLAEMVKKRLTEEPQ